MSDGDDVIDLATRRIVANVRRMARETQAACDHSAFRIEAAARQVSCEDCCAVLDPFDALVRIGARGFAGLPMTWKQEP